MAEARRRIRFTGPRKIAKEKGLPAAGAQGVESEKRRGDGGNGGVGQVTRRFPEAAPDVCCAFLSSGRLNLLRRSLAALIRWSSPLSRASELAFGVWACQSWRGLSISFSLARSYSLRRRFVATSLFR